MAFQKLFQKLGPAEDGVGNPCQPTSASMYGHALSTPAIPHGGIFMALAALSPLVSRTETESRVRPAVLKRDNQEGQAQKSTKKVIVFEEPLDANPHPSR